MTVIAEQVPTIESLQDELNELDGRRMALESSISKLKAMTRYHSTPDDDAELNRLNADRDDVLNEITILTSQVADLESSTEKERKSVIAKREKQQKKMAENLTNLARSAMSARSEISERRAELLPELISLLERFDQSVQAYRARHSEFIDSGFALGEIDTGAMGGYRASPALTGMLDRLNAEQPEQQDPEPMPSGSIRRLIKVAEHLLQTKRFEQQKFGLNNR